MEQTRRMDGIEVTIQMSEAIAQYLANAGVDFQRDVVGDDWRLFQTWLFDVLDEDRDGIPDEKFGQRFTLIINEVWSGRTRVMHEPEPSGGTTIATGNVRAGRFRISYLLQYP